MPKEVDWKEEIEELLERVADLEAMHHGVMTAIGGVALAVLDAGGTDRARMQAILECARVLLQIEITGRSTDADDATWPLEELAVVLGSQDWKAGEVLDSLLVAETTAFRRGKQPKDQPPEG